MINWLKLLNGLTTVTSAPAYAIEEPKLSISYDSNLQETNDSNIEKTNKEYIFPATVWSAFKSFEMNHINERLMFIFTVFEPFLDEFPKGHPYFEYHKNISTYLLKGNQNLYVELMKLEANLRLFLMECDNYAYDLRHEAKRKYKQYENTIKRLSELGKDTENNKIAILLNRINDRNATYAESLNRYLTLYIKVILDHINSSLLKSY